MNSDALNGPAPAAGARKYGGRAGLLIPALACAVMMGLVASTYSYLSPSFDEPLHISAGVAIIQSGDYVSGFEHPPLARWPIGLLPYLAGVQYRPGGGVFDEAKPGYPLSTVLYDENPDHMRSVVLGRMGVLVFIPVLLFTLYVWTTRLFGPTAGAAAVALGAFSPNLMAHAGVAAIDFPAAAMLLLAAYRTYRWAEEPTVKNGCVCAAAVALAAMTKYSILVFLPPIGFLYWAALSGKRATRGAAAAHGWGGRLQRGALYAAIAFIVAWACYSFAARPISSPDRRPHAMIDRFVTPGSTLSQGLYWFEENVPVPFIDTVNGLRTVYMHNQAGHPAFLLGEVRKTGWWYYFPAVIFFKTTLPLLALVLMAIVMMAVEPNARAGRIYSLGAVVAILGVSMTSSINIGVRHILPAYPFLAMLAASVFQGVDAAAMFRRWLPRLAGVLVIWHIGEGVAGMPDNISYFNETVRGREYMILGDSNLDWGQGLFELRDFVQKNQIDSLTFRYFGSVDPRNFGVPEAIPFREGEQPRGWVACSVTYVQAIYEPGCPLLAGREAVSKIGRTVWAARIP